MTRRPRPLLRCLEAFAEVKCRHESESQILDAHPASRIGAAAWLMGGGTLAWRAADADEMPFLALSFFAAAPLLFQIYLLTIVIRRRRRRRRPNPDCQLCTLNAPLPNNGIMSGRDDFDELISPLQGFGPMGRTGPRAWRPGLLDCRPYRAQDNDCNPSWRLCASA
jgi:hypothetical protein